MPWTVPQMWKDGDVYILGGGPSLPKTFGIPEDIIQKVRSGELTPEAYSPYMKVLHDKHVIAINMSYKIGNWIDVLFFGDQGFYTKFGNEKAVHKFQGLKVTCNKWFDNPVYFQKGFKALDRERTNHSSENRGITTDPTKVVWNNNSGAASINFAFHTGAKRVILLGFDMNADDDNSHWHKLYGERRGCNYDSHKRGFKAIAEDAKKLGMEVYNGNFNSAIKDFEFKSLEDFIAEGKPISICVDEENDTNNIKIGVVIPTCSPERKEFVKFLTKRLKNQTLQPNKIYWINYPNETNDPDISRRYKEGLSKAFADGMDLVLLVEDDDYYPLDYIEKMKEAWIEQETPDLIGVHPTVYYNVITLGYKTFIGEGHASAFCTAVSKKATIDVAHDNDAFYDLRIWKNNFGKLVKLVNPPLGIKHGIGRTGGKFHKNSKYTDFDKDLSFLKSRVDDEAFKFYKKIIDANR